MKRAIFSAALSLITTSLCTALAAAPVPVRLIAINDLHGHLEPGELSIRLVDPDDPTRTAGLSVGGAAHLATLVKQLRSAQPASLFISSGDLIGASPLISGLFHDEPTIEAMNAMGLDINAVGNHEFDRGLGELMRIVRGGCRQPMTDERPSCIGPDRTYTGARFFFLSANVIDAKTGQTTFAPSVVRQFGDVKVGVIGAVTRSTPGIVMPVAVAGVRFIDEARAINQEAAALKAQGVHAIVAVVHEGGEVDGGLDDCINPRGPIFDIARALAPSVDIVLSGHTHRAYRCEIDGRWVTQAASFGRLVTVIDLQIDPQLGVLRDRTVARNVPVSNGQRTSRSMQQRYAPLVPDPTVQAIVAHYRERAAPIAQRPIGRITAPFDRRPSAGGDHALGRLIADAQLAATRDHGAEIAFTNPGGVRADLRAAAAGNISYADAYAVQPFGNTLVTLTLSGAQLRALLEQQWSKGRPERARMLQPSRGLTYAWDVRQPPGQRIVADSLRLHGRPIDDGRGYRVTVNDYLAAGGDGFRVLRSARDAVGGPLDVDALAQYLQTQSQRAPVSPDRAARIRRRG